MEVLAIPLAIALGTIAILIGFYIGSRSKPVGDTTSISSGIGEAKQSVENNRVALVQQLASQVSRGSYQPNPQQIADAILDEAIVDAELEAAG